MERSFNFSPGPAALPLTVLERIRDELVCLPGSRASILEVSHRSPEFERILLEAEANIRELLAVGGAHQVLFLQGGARQQFSLIPMNFLRGSGKRAAYVLSGYWSRKAHLEAPLEGEVQVAWDGESVNHARLPRPGEIADIGGAAYLHYTSNETIQGLQFAEAPHVEPEVPLICDASSDLLCRPLDVNIFGMVYASAQKNLGPSGVTVAIVRNDLLERVPDGLHTMLDYRQHAAAGSVLNTPPVFPIYVVKLMTDWLKDEIGGVENMEAINRRKSGLIYDAIDASDGFYRGHAQSDRSMMNVTFRLPSEELEKAFMAETTDAGLVELKGHRSIGGVRASLYNGVPELAAERLAEFMVSFRNDHG